MLFNANSHGFKRFFDACVVLNWSQKTKKQQQLGGGGETYDHFFHDKQNKNKVRRHTHRLATKLGRAPITGSLEIELSSLSAAAVNHFLIFRQKGPKYMHTHTQASSFTLHVSIIFPSIFYMQNQLCGVVELTVYTRSRLHGLSSNEQAAKGGSKVQRAVRYIFFFYFVFFHCYAKVIKVKQRERERESLFLFFPFASDPIVK